MFEPPAAILMTKLLGFLSIAVSLALGLACLALGVLGKLDGTEMTVDLLPVAPESTVATLFAIGILGTLSALLATRGGGWMSVPLLLWSLAIVTLLGATVFRAGYRFDGVADLVNHGLWFLTSLILLLASWLRFRTPAGRHAGP